MIIINKQMLRPFTKNYSCSIELDRHALQYHSNSVLPDVPVRLQWCTRTRATCRWQSYETKVDQNCDQIDLRMQFLKFFVLSLALHLHQVRGDSLEALRAELGQRTTNLDASFKDKIHDVFYKSRQDAEETGNKAMLHFAVKVAQLELLHYIRERRALLIAGSIFLEHFSPPSSSIFDNGLPKTKSLADLILYRLIQKTCEDEPEVEQDLRKTIHDLYHAYDPEEFVEDIAREHALRVEGRKARAVKAKAFTESALERVKTDLADQVTDQQVFNISKFVDELIYGAETRFALRPMAGLSDRVSRDIAEAARETWNYAIPNSRYDTTKDIVRAYETGVALSFKREIIFEINAELIDLEDDFMENIRHVFDIPHELAAASQTGDIPLMAVSARMAEFEALLYAAEEKMKMIVKGIFTQCLIERNKELTDPLIENSNLIYLIWYRSTEHALESAFRQAINLRKEIYLLLRSNQHAYIQRLARRFYESMKDKEQRCKEANVINSRFLKKYINEVSYVLSDRQIEDTLRVVDLLLQDAMTEVDSISMQDMDLRQYQSHKLEQLVGTDEFAKIMAARSAYQMDPDEVEALDMRDVLAYENQFNKRSS